MKTRLILIIILTLAIGFVLGMLTSAQLRLHKLRPMRVYFSDDRFREGFYKIIQPDEQQKATIDQIIEKHAKVNGEIQGRFRKELDANLKALRKELDSKLTKEQQARLKEMDERREEMMKEARKRHMNDTVNFRNRRPNQFRRQMPSDGPPPPPPPHEGDTVNIN